MGAFEKLGDSIHKHPYWWIAGGALLVILILYLLFSGSSSSAQSSNTGYLSAYYAAEATAANSNNQLQSNYAALQAQSLQTTTAGNVAMGQTAGQVAIQSQAISAAQEVATTQSNNSLQEALAAIGLGSQQSTQALAAVENTNAAQVTTASLPFNPDFYNALFGTQLNLAITAQQGQPGSALQVVNGIPVGNPSLVAQYNQGNNPTPASTGPLPMWGPNPFPTPNVPGLTAW